MARAKRIAIAEIAKTRDDAKLGGIPLGPPLWTQAAVRVAGERDRCAVRQLAPWGVQVTTQHARRAGRGFKPAPQHAMEARRRDGIGVQKDLPRAVQIFENACHQATDDDDVDADENQSRACALLGALYLTGDGVKKDLTAGRELSEQACEGNDAFGCFNAAQIYATGLGVEADPVAAARFYDTACESDDGESCYELAQFYQEGRGVDRDAARAAELMRRACTLGFQKSCK